MNIQNKSGLRISFLGNGAIRNIENDQVRVNLRSGNPYSSPLSNVYLRKRDHLSISFTPLSGVKSTSEFSIFENAFFIKGIWQGLEYIGKLDISDASDSWKWNIKVMNQSGSNCEVDLIMVQDVGLKAVSDGLVNEYYVSQYTERILLNDPQFGTVVCCRQNMKEPSGHPWAMFGCTEFASSGCTDGLQFYGNEFRATGIPKALNQDKLDGNLAGESSIVAIQQQPFTLLPGETKQVGFIGIFLADHPAATSVKDLERMHGVLKEFPLFHPEQISEISDWKKPAENLLNTADLLPVEELTNAELNSFFGSKVRHKEVRDDKILSLFTHHGSHVVLKHKERLVDRPHGHILQANIGFEPSEDVISTTCYATGIFNAHLSQGNTNFNVLLSIPASQFNLQTETGQRIMVEIDGQNFLLGIPSAFEMGLNYCRWIYKSSSHIFEIRTWTSVDQPLVYTDFKILSGEPLKLYLTHHFDQVNSWKVTKKDTGDQYFIEPVAGMILDKFPQARFSLQLHDPMPSKYEDVTDRMDENIEVFPASDHFLVLKLNGIRSFFLSFSGELRKTHDISQSLDADNQFSKDQAKAKDCWDALSLGIHLEGNDADSQALGEILPWYGNNALVHFLTPYGLEQFSGAAWGTRDVAQGPIELLLQTEKYAEARNVLLTVFRHQNAFGDWPQWWMFDSYRAIRAGDCHGDIYYWVLIALANYVKTTGDIGILKEKVPYYDEDQQLFTIAEHVDRLIRMITDSYIEGTSLVPFGGGDWNDSLQPVSRELSQKLISSWTVEMNYQAFKAYSEVFERTGEIVKAAKLKEICDHINSDLNRYLIKDGIIAGYGYLESPGNFSLLLHPSDTKTGIRYSILPMNRGIISGIFTKKQAEDHQKIIDQWLKGPDGARLMDKPLKYKGGIQDIFQRAESSTFFGREIGLMYIHEHIRYAESQALLGNAEAFVHALRQAIPIDYQKVVECGDLRQANCYYSSSDVIFSTRYEADDKYHEILEGKQMVKGGWRVYSSGPGIFVSLVISKLLGIRLESDRIIIDPVIPKKMDGLKAKIRIKTNYVHIEYRLTQGTFSPKKILLNGSEIPFNVENNLYREGGAVLELAGFLPRLNLPVNELLIEL